MRVDNAEHQRHPFRVHTYAREFELLDVWRYPIVAERADQFDEFVAIHDLKSMVAESSVIVRGLFVFRAWLGRVFRWDADGDAFREVYRDDRELVLRVENATVTALMHLGWVSRGDGWTALLAVYANPKGRLGRTYMSLIAPFRHRFVYPALMRAGQRRWERRNS